MNRGMIIRKLGEYLFRISVACFNLSNVEITLTYPRPAFINLRKYLTFLLYIHYKLTCLTSIAQTISVLNYASCTFMINFYNFSGKHTGILDFVWIQYSENQL